jgi:phage N-6-adenine-methyltransferase
MIPKALVTSRTDEWETPQELFDALNHEFGFTLDVCATKENAQCPDYFSEAEDGLKQEWRGVCWLNPPYGREIAKWIKKASESARRGAIVVCLIPCRTDTAWFHDFILGKAEIRFLRGRLTYANANHPAPFPNAVVVFSNKRRFETSKRLCLDGLEGRSELGSPVCQVDQKAKSQAERNLMRIPHQREVPAY